MTLSDVNPKQRMTRLLYHNCLAGQALLTSVDKAYAVSSHTLVACGLIAWFVPSVR